MNFKLILFALLIQTAVSEIIENDGFGTKTTRLIMFIAIGVGVILCIFGSIGGFFIYKCVTRQKSPKMVDITADETLSDTP
uniref:Uncharacterized protein n=1 Tax=Panagrellus redivivus TaxID=6233 RepID=A0A7E5A0N4_PANRE